VSHHHHYMTMLDHHRRQSPLSSSTFTTRIWLDSLFRKRLERRAFSSVVSSILSWPWKQDNDDDKAKKQQDDDTTTTTTTTTTREQQQQQQQQHQRHVSCGIFIDLDNMADTPELYGPNLTRETVARIMGPFAHWIQYYSTSTCSTTLCVRRKMAAYANQHTVKYRPRPSSTSNSSDQAKLGRERLLQQEYWNGAAAVTSLDDDDDDDDDKWEEDLIMNEMHNRTKDPVNVVAQTGYDDKGILRCGICGAKMQLSKKDQARGWDEHDKLDKHMRTLHDREQRKRTMRLASWSPSKRRKRLNQSPNPHNSKWSKIMKRVRKYDSAQVGLGRHPLGQNDLFPILKEKKVECILCNNVDQVLVQHVTKWLEKNRRRHKKAAKEQQQQQQQQEDKTLVDESCDLATSDSSGEQQHKTSTVVTMVVSEDSDFQDILRRCSSSASSSSNSSKKMTRIAVTATWRSSRQTQALVDVSDIVITRATAADDYDDDGDHEKDDTGVPSARTALFVATAVTANGRALLQDFPFRD
jgi:hypothetical protein